MKYYYKDKLVRTSKNEYHYGLYNGFTGEMIACSKTKAGITNQYNKYYNDVFKPLPNMKRRSYSDLNDREVEYLSKLAIVELEAK